MASEDLGELNEDRNGWARAKGSLLEIALWLAGSSIILLAVGVAWRQLDSLVDEAKYSPPVFVFIAAMLASGLAYWRLERPKGERIAPFFGAVAFAALLMEANSYEPFCYGDAEEYRAIGERQSALVDQWYACTQGNDDACQQVMDQPERLHQLQRKREALLQWMC